MNAYIFNKETRKICLKCEDIVKCVDKMIYYKGCGIEINDINDYVVTDLELKIGDIVDNNIEDYREKFIEKNSNELLTKSIAELVLENKQKSILIGNLAQQINNLNIKIKELGGNK